ncbi:glycosyltransferase family 4 protein [Thermodesulfobacteriota bacterium]
MSEIDRNPHIDLTICANIKFPGEFSLIKPTETSFRLINRKTYIVPLPFIKARFYLQPEAIWSMLVRKYDVFVMSNRMTELTAWINLGLGRLLGRRVCLWGHGFSKRDGQWKTKLRKLMMCLAHVNILYSQSGRDKALEMGLPPEKLFIAYNALDTRQSKAIRDGILTEDLELFGKENNLVEKKIVLFSGRLQQRKKPEILVQAMQKIIYHVPNAVAIIVGDGEMREELERLIKDLKLGNCVRLIGAVYDEEIMARYLLWSSVAVMPAHAGLAIQHAFDYGVPIVVGDNMEEHPPEIELVKNGETGIFCKDGDVDEFSEAILRLLTNGKGHQRMSINCRKLIEEKYNVENMAKGIMDALKYAYRVTFNGP